MLLAGGSGQRFGKAKQFVFLYGFPVYVHALSKYEGLPVILLVPEENVDEVEYQVQATYDFDNVSVISGGQTRQESVWKGLQFCKQEFPDCKNIIISEASRPLISKATIKKCIEALKEYICVVAVTKSVDTMCLGENGYLKGVFNRSHMYNMLMPQCFPFNSLYEGHASTQLINATDDTQIVPWITPMTYLLEIPRWEGIKLTVRDDIPIIDYLLRMGDYE